MGDDHPDHPRNPRDSQEVARGTDDPSPTLRTPPNRHLLPSDPLRTPHRQVLSLRNQTLVNRTGQQGDAVLADLVAEVLAGDANA